MSEESIRKTINDSIMSKFKQMEQKKECVQKYRPPAWVFLHTVAHNYPLKPTRQDRKNYKNFLKVLDIYYLVIL